MRRTSRFLSPVLFTIAVLPSSYASAQLAHPVANAGGPYTFTLDASSGNNAFLISGSATSTNPGASFSYWWDLNGDGLFGTGGSTAATGDASAQSASFLVPQDYFTNVTAGTAYNLQLQVSDGFQFAWSGTTALATSAAPVPEPATWAMMLLGFGGIGFAVRRRNSAKLQLA